jgi:hypothetical protein
MLARYGFIKQTLRREGHKLGNGIAPPFTGGCDGKQDDGKIDLAR